MIQISKYEKTIDEILSDLPERTRDVISKRCGMEKKASELKEKNLKRKGETLEKIGNEFNITRERVRQIENKGVETIQKSSKFKKIKDLFLEIQNFIDENGGLKKENLLELSLAPDVRQQPYLLFILKIGKPFFYKPDSPSLHPLWKTKEDAIETAEKVNNLFVKLIKEKKRLLKLEEILKIGKKEIPQKLKIKIPENHIASYIEVTKKIEKNSFGEYGLSSWSDITPKGVKDKAYIVLKKINEPLHFKDLADEIEKKLNMPVQANTLHNELIKNKNFVLIGRGTYALKEWGFKNGTVKDIIEGLLEEKKALLKEKIIEEVKKQRRVKDTTIILNLQHFNKNEDGEYIL